MHPTMSPQRLVEIERAAAYLDRKDKENLAFNITFIGGIFAGFMIFFVIAVIIVTIVGP